MKNKMIDRYFKSILFILMMCVPFSGYTQSHGGDTGVREEIGNVVPDDTDAATENTDSKTGADEEEVVPRKTQDHYTSNSELELSKYVLAFGFLVLLIELYLIKTQAVPANTMVRFVLITLIITGTLFLITAGYGNDQISPAVGLFGTVAGYLLGKSGTKKDGNED